MLKRTSQHVSQTSCADEISAPGATPRCQLPNTINYTDFVSHRRRQGRKFDECSRRVDLCLDATRITAAGDYSHHAFSSDTSWNHKPLPFHYNHDSLSRKKHRRHIVWKLPFSEIRVTPMVLELVGILFRHDMNKAKVAFFALQDIIQHAEPEELTAALSKLALPEIRRRLRAAPVITPSWSSLSALMLIIMELLHSHAGYRAVVCQYIGSLLQSMQRQFASCKRAFPYRHMRGNYIKNGHSCACKRKNRQPRDGDGCFQGGGGGSSPFCSCTKAKYHVENAGRAGAGLGSPFKKICGIAQCRAAGAVIVSGDFGKTGPNTFDLTFIDQFATFNSWLIELDWLVIRLSGLHSPDHVQFTRGVRRFCGSYTPLADVLYERWKFSPEQSVAQTQEDAPAERQESSRLSFRVTSEQAATESCGTSCFLEEMPTSHIKELQPDLAVYRPLASTELSGFEPLMTLPDDQALPRRMLYEEERRVAELVAQEPQRQSIQIPGAEPIMEPPDEQAVPNTAQNTPVAELIPGESEPRSTQLPVDEQLQQENYGPDTMATLESIVTEELPTVSYNRTSSIGDARMDRSDDSFVLTDEEFRRESLKETTNFFDTLQEDQLPATETTELVDPHHELHASMLAFNPASEGAKLDILPEEDEEEEEAAVYLDQPDNLDVVNSKTGLFQASDSVESTVMISRFPSRLQEPTNHRSTESSASLNAQIEDTLAAEHDQLDDLETATQQQFAHLYTEVSLESIDEAQFEDGKRDKTEAEIAPIVAPEESKASIGSADCQSKAPAAHDLFQIDESLEIASPLEDQIDRLSDSTALPDVQFTREDEEYSVASTVSRRSITTANGIMHTSAADGTEPSQVIKKRTSSIKIFTQDVVRTQESNLLPDEVGSTSSGVMVRQQFSSQRSVKLGIKGQLKPKLGLIRAERPTRTISAKDPPVLSIKRQRSIFSDGGESATAVPSAPSERKSSLVNATQSHQIDEPMICEAENEPETGADQVDHFDELLQLQQTRDDNAPSPGLSMDHKSEEEEEKEQCETASAVKNDEESLKKTKTKEDALSYHLMVSGETFAEATNKEPGNVRLIHSFTVGSQSVRLYSNDLGNQDTSDSPKKNTKRQSGSSNALRNVNSNNSLSKKRLRNNSALLGVDGLVSVRSSGPRGNCGVANDQLKAATVGIKSHQGQLLTIHHHHNRSPHKVDKLDTDGYLKATGTKPQQGQMFSIYHHHRKPLHKVGNWNCNQPYEFAKSDTDGQPKAGSKLPPRGQLKTPGGKLQQGQLISVRQYQQRPLHKVGNWNCYKPYESAQSDISAGPIDADIEKEVCCSSLSDNKGYCAVCARRYTGVISKTQQLRWLEPRKSLHYFSKPFIQERFRFELRTDPTAAVSETEGAGQKRREQPPRARLHNSAFMKFKEFSCEAVPNAEVAAKFNWSIQRTNWKPSLVCSPAHVSRLPVTETLWTRPFMKAYGRSQLGCTAASESIKKGRHLQKNTTTTRYSTIIRQNTAEGYCSTVSKALRADIARHLVDRALQKCLLIILSNATPSNGEDLD